MPLNTLRHTVVFFLETSYTQISVHFTFENEIVWWQLLPEGDKSGSRYCTVLSSVPHLS